MQMAATTFGEAVQEVYEDDWTGRDTILKSFAVCFSFFFYLVWIMLIQAGFIIVYFFHA